MKSIVLIVLVCAVALHAYPAPEEDERSIENEVKSDLAGEEGDAGGITLEKIGDLDGEVRATVQSSPSAKGIAKGALKVGTAIAVVPAVVETLKKGVEAIGDLFGKIFG